MVQRKSDQINILREKAAAKLTKELEELPNLSAEELKMRYFENPMPDSRFNELENKLQKEVEDLQTIFNASPISICTKDTKNNFVRVNKAAAKFVGLEIHEIIGRSSDEIFPLDSEKFYKDDLEVISTGKSKIGIIESHKAKGETRWVRTDKIPWYLPTGEIAGVIAFARDITELRIAEQNLKNSEELFRRVITNAPISIFATDVKGFFTLHEGKAIERVGMKAGENVGVSAYDLFSGIQVIEHNGTVTTGKAVLDRVSKGEYLSGITELNGVIFDNQFAPIWDENNKVVGLLGVATDITERKQAEEELRESETFNRMLFDQSVIGLALARMDGQFVDVNQAFAQIIGRTIDETINLRYWGITPEKYAEQEKIQLDLLNNTGRFGPFEKEYIHKNGNLVPVRLQGVIIERKGEKYIWSSVEDITGRKRMEKNIRESEERYRLLFENSIDAILLTEPGGGIYSANPAACIMFQKTEEEICKQGRDRQVNSNDPRLPVFLDERRKSGNAIGELTLIRKDGTIFPAEVSSSIFYDSQGEPRTAMIIRDITKRKLAEEKLQHSEHNLAEAERIGNSGSWEYHVATDTASWSKNMFRIFDVDPEIPQELVFRHFIENLVHPDDKEHVLSVFHNALTGKRPYDLEYRIIHKDGNIRAIHAIAETLFDESGKATYMIGKVEDISERNRMLSSLKESRDLFRNTISSLNEAVFLVDPESRLISDCNLAAEEIFGYTRAEIINQTTLFLHVDKTMYDEFGRRMNLGIKENGFFQTEYKVKRKNGEIFPSENFIRPLLDKEGKIIMVLSVLRDITDRKKTQELIKYQSSLFENVHDAILATDKNFRITAWNFAAEELYGWKANEVVGKIIQEVIHAEFTPEQRSEALKLLSEGTFFGAKLIQYRKDGREILVEGTTMPLFDEKKNITGYVSLNRDITEQARNEEERSKLFTEIQEADNQLRNLSRRLLETQETERKNISRELHDEVGQSLTAMKINLASILKKLPAEHDAKTQSRLQEMNEIIEHLISQVHEISLNLRPAMLDVLGLLPTLKSYSNQFSVRTGILVHIENDIKINLEKEQEIHLYRIVQEAFTNVAKHAHAKNIIINLSIRGNILILSVQDNGCGFILSEKENIPHPGIGLIGMKERVNSLKGNMKINTSPEKGTNIEIQIPIIRKHE